jgi:hypothetical protein
MSNAKINARIESLTAIANRSKMESIYLASASCKIDNKTASQRFNQVQKSPFLNEILGDCPLPTFNEFVAELPIKKDGVLLYSESDAFRTLGRISKKYVKVDTNTIESVLEIAPIIIAPIITESTKKAPKNSTKETTKKSSAVKIDARAKRQQKNTDKK